MKILHDINYTQPFVPFQSERESILLDGLNELTKHHKEKCVPYQQMLQSVYGQEHTGRSLATLPFLPVRLFKHQLLKSVPEASVVRQLTSSGTTGQQVSRIFLDAETSALQVKALTSIVQNFIGRQRLPMLIIDQREVISGKSSFSARAAGILGFSNFGRQHTYALDADMQPKWDVIEQFISEHQGKPILLFGFTFVIWEYFLKAAKMAGRTLNFGSDSILIHGGGWKKLSEYSVDNSTFKEKLAEQFGIRRVSNYYGMVEQVGSVFMECEAGYFHTPAFADVIMRDPISLELASHGVVQVMSLLPRSYPGHVILTEDMGTILGVDDCSCGRRGKYFHIHGRIPRAEVRGCSDVREI
jgi:hypothetical protein